MATGTIYKTPVYFQTGYVNTEVSATSIAEYPITFSTPFQTAPAVQLTMFSATTSVNGGALVQCALKSSPTTTGFTIRVFNGDTSQRSPRIDWLAISN